MFSFTRLRGADPTLGVEMSSTGEVACFGHDVHEAFLQVQIRNIFTISRPHPFAYYFPPHFSDHSGRIGSSCLHFQIP